MRNCSIQATPMTSSVLSNVNTFNKWAVDIPSAILLFFKCIIQFTHSRSEYRLLNDVFLWILNQCMNTNCCTARCCCFARVCPNCFVRCCLIKALNYYLHTSFMLCFGKMLSEPFICIIIRKLCECIIIQNERRGENDNGARADQSLITEREMYQRVGGKSVGKLAFSMHAEGNPQVGRGPVMTTTELRAHNRQRVIFGTNRYIMN